MALNAALDDQIAISGDGERAFGELDESGRVIGSAHAAVVSVAAVETEGGAAIGGAESVADPAGVDAEVRGRDVVERQRVLVSRTA